MYQKLINLLLILLLVSSCSKDEVVLNIPVEKEQSIEVYAQAVEAMTEGDYFFAAKKFLEAESILPTIDYSAKASLMASYCFYVINFYEEAVSNLEKFTTTYPANKNIPYANYLIAISVYEQILDEKKDIGPLLATKSKINNFLERFPETDYAIDLKFKLDLVNNQLAAKEMYVAKYYIKAQKWIPAINSLKTIVNKYNETIFIEEALHRMVEIYYKIGLEEEAKSAAVLLGYNYNSSIWYEKSYKILNKNYKIPELQNRKENQKENGLITRTIKKLTKW